MLATQLLHYYITASTYGSDAYNKATYNGTDSVASGSLSNTGIALVGIVTIAALIILIAMVVRIWKRSGKSLDKQNITPKD